MVLQDPVALLSSKIPRSSRILWSYGEECLKHSQDDGHQQGGPECGGRIEDDHPSDKNPLPGLRVCLRVLMHVCMHVCMYTYV